MYCTEESMIISVQNTSTTRKNNIKRLFILEYVSIMLPYIDRLFKQFKMVVTLTRVALRAFF